MKDVGDQTRMAPERRMDSLRKWIHRVKDTPEAYEQFTKWGLELSDDVLDLNGRLLNQEMILWGSGNPVSAGYEASWNRSFGRELLCNPVDIPDDLWMIVFSRNCRPAAEKARDKLIEMGRKFGMTIGRPEMVLVNSDTTPDLLTAVRESLKPQRTKLVVFIFGTKRADKYSAVKKLCCIERPVASQVIMSKTLSQMHKLNSVAQKIVAQIDAKLGGELWQVKIPLAKLMVCGFDCYHETKTKRPSAGNSEGFEP
jgi:aubergine-like protein